MRLADHQLYSYSLKYERPVRWSDIVEEAAPFVALRLTSDDGHVGVGEITVKPTWCGVTARSLIASIQEIFIPMLSKLDLSDPEQVRQRLDGVPENNAAKALIDNACWDLRAAGRSTPLWQFWGGSPRVEVSWAVTRQAPAAMAAEAADMVERYGFRTLKIKGGQGTNIDVEGLREIRAVVGDNTSLYVDANGAYAPHHALNYTKAMADAGASVMEDPCPLVPNVHFDELRALSPIPVLVDFGCTSLRDASLFLERGAAALSAKPSRFGLSHCRAMQARATQSGARVVAGLMGESALGTLAGLQFAATITAPILPAELTWFLAMTEQVVVESPRIVDGAIELSGTSSLASIVDWKKLDRLVQLLAS
jgi:L-alanine-DL-glutamate epimerase-like enolase superfamily enzyme